MRITPKRLYESIYAWRKLFLTCLTIEVGVVVVGILICEILGAQYTVWTFAGTIVGPAYMIFATFIKRDYSVWYNPLYAIHLTPHPGDITMLRGGNNILASKQSRQGPAVAKYIRVNKISAWANEWFADEWVIGITHEDDAVAILLLI